MYFAIILIVVAIDQIIKYFVRTGLNQADIIPVLGDFLTIKLHFNTGAAFSILEGYRIFLLTLPAIMVILIIGYLIARRKKDHPLLLTALAIIAGGGIGNLIDRFFLGKVTDFISVGTFPIFNFADMCVVSGCFLIVIYLIFFDGKNKKAQDGTL